MNKKIVAHIIAILLMVSGLIVIHVVLNTDSGIMICFGTIVNNVFMIDISIVMILVAFFIEFYMTFKQMKVS